jgi:hypothetical protein
MAAPFWAPHRRRLPPGMRSPMDLDSVYDPAPLPGDVLRLVQPANGGPGVRGLGFPPSRSPFDEQPFALVVAGLLGVGETLQLWISQFGAGPHSGADSPAGMGTPPNRELHPCSCSRESLHRGKGRPVDLRFPERKACFIGASYGYGPVQVLEGRVAPPTRASTRKSLGINAVDGSAETTG